MTTNLDDSLLDDLLTAIAHAEDKFGRQYDVPDGTGDAEETFYRDQARLDCQEAFGRGDGTWRHILTEEFYEATAEDDPTALRAELLQVAAVALRWADAINHRPAVTA
jgi:hypothetical protein